MGFSANQNNDLIWYTFDFQVGYDPCACNDLTYLDFDFRAVESSNISLYGRQITLVENLTDANGNPIYDDGFLSVQDVNSNAESGYIFRDKLGSLVDDYNTSLETYNQQMEDKEFGKLGWFRDLLDDVREQAIGAAVDFIPGGEIASFLIDKNLNLGADSSNINKAVNSGGKALLGQGYDFFSNQIFGENVEPVRPSIPTASFSEMRFSGTVQTDNFIGLNGFINPGSDFFGSDLTPFNYPAYNEVLGLYATLRTPQVQLLENNSSLQAVVTNTIVEVDSSDFDDSFTPNYTRVDSTIWKTITYSQNLYLKLKDPLQYALNTAVDMDASKTKVYVSFNVKLETDEPYIESPPNIYRIDSIRYEFSENTNLWTIHDITAGSYPGNLIKRKIELVSGWYEAKEVTNLLFGSYFSTSVYYKELFEKDYIEGGGDWYFHDEFNEEVPIITEQNIKYRPVQITMKVMSDMYFDQLSYTDEKINTTQVFTYLLLDQEKGVDLITDHGNIVPPAATAIFVNMYPGELTIFSNILTPFAPEVILSNYGSSPSSIYADRIIINNELEGSDDGTNPTYNIEAYSEIKVKVGSHLKPSLKLSIKRDVYGGALSEPASPSELTAFCQSENYNSGILSAKALKAYKKREETLNSDFKDEDIIQNSLLIHPNPAVTQIAVTSSNNPISEIQIFDVSGRLLINEQYGKSKVYQVLLPIDQLNSGIYVVHAICDGDLSSKKLVVSK